MREINSLEKEKIYKWACRNHTKEIEDRYFTKIDKNSESYFEKKIYPIEYCYEYTFQTVVELRSALSALWKDDSIMEEIYQVVLVAAMKNKPSSVDEDDVLEKMGEIKPFIYNF